MAYMQFDDLLISAGLINEEQLQQAIELQKSTGLRLGEALISSKIITEQQLIDALQLQLGIDFVDLTLLSIPPELAKYVPGVVAKKYNVIPVKLVRDELYIAMIDPLDFIAQEEVKAASHKNIIPMIATRAALDKSINTLYGSENAAKAMDDMRREAGVTNPDIVPVQMSNAEDDESAAPTVRFVNAIIERAVSERASDIHLEPQAEEMVVRMRIDGLLRRIMTIPTEVQNTVISRIKIMGGMNISEHKIPQDGRAMMNVKQREIDARISSMPTVYGEKIVMRLLDKTSHSVSSQSIGLENDDLKKYQMLLKNSSGVILIVGPTGSGKSTTMCAMIQELCDEETNIMTLEDPVEYNIPGVNQCQINEKTGMTFAKGLRALLRQDPDIISVGEIRDGETASIAIRAAITGHLVLSTLHTNDAIAALDRLLDIGVEPYMLSGAIRGVVSQRLLRKICPHCRKPYKPAPEQLAELGMDADFGGNFYKGEGCPECYRTGYKGRRAAFEILVISKELRQAINSGAGYDEIFEAARRNGFVTLKENCIDLVTRGETSFEEASKAINSSAE